jgi:hypothetical protein
MRDAHGASARRCRPTFALHLPGHCCQGHNFSLNENRGHSGENEQHAPQVGHSETVISVGCVGKTVI